MIVLSVTKENNSVKELVVAGHSGYATEGNDIVCASVSSMVTITVNAILKMQNDAITFESKKGYVKIVVLHPSYETELLLENLLEMVKELTETYGKYLKIKEEV